jgi:hypothetical protein
MAKRAMMMCPRCRMVGLNEVELVTGNPEDDVFRCANSHAFTNYLDLMRLNPDKIKLVPVERPGANDIKVEVFVNSEIWERFKKAYPHQVNATVQSILQLYLLGTPVIIDGVQAKRLNAMGVHTGAEMVAALEVSKTTEDQLATVTGQLALIQGMLEKASINVGA